MRTPQVRGTNVSRRRRFIRIIAIALLSLGACSPPGPGGDIQGGPRVVRDDADRIIPVHIPPERIVSLVPSMTDMVVALGGAGRLVARTRYDRGMAVAHLPSLGGGLNPNVEALAGLRPDLVLVTPDEDIRSTVGRLEQAGIHVYAGRTGTLEDIRRLAMNVGMLLGEDGVREADLFLDSLDAGLQSLEERAEGMPRPTLFYLVWNDPPMTVGPGTFLHDVITAAGATNLFADSRIPWPQVSLEEILRRDPDWVILTDEQAGGDGPLRWIEGAPGWRDLRAVKEGRVAVVEADLFNRPGPRVLEAARSLSALIHP